MMEDIRGKHVSLSIEDPDELYRFAHALASPVRIRIMKTLDERSMNVGELAQKLEIPMSSAALGAYDRVLSGLHGAAGRAVSVCPEVLPAGHLRAGWC